MKMEEAYMTLRSLADYMEKGFEQEKDERMIMIGVIREDMEAVRTAIETMADYMAVKSYMKGSVKCE